MSSHSFSALGVPMSEESCLLSQGTFFTMCLVTSHPSGLWEELWSQVGWNHSKTCVLYSFAHLLNKHL